MNIKRDAFPRLLDELNRRETSILLGARQTGKTFLLKQLHKKAVNSGLRAVYYNLELPSDLKLFNRTDSEMYKFLASAGEALFIDEFHYMKNASKIFKMLFDSGRKVKIYASGSSSLEIHKHLKESLAGRRLVSKLLPLSYNEFLRKYKTGGAAAAFGEYALYGGLPGLLKLKSADEKIRELNEILETYIQKDVKSLIKEENIRAFNSLLYLLAENQGSLISEHGLSREVGLTSATVNRHISILEKTYVCYPVCSYAVKLGNELKKSKKIYFYDLGIRNMLVKDFSPYPARRDKGVLAETFVFLQLLSLLKPNMEIRFWRNKAGSEIDFVILKNRKPFILEVKTALSACNLPGAFPTFINHYPETEGGMVISGNLEKTVEYNGKEIEFSTFDDFLGKLESKLSRM
ncbi:MAG: ATP-binding protein [Elusimicrobia bacterium]|nr:ATP-binding protein [Elusimicrobiota bacterium]